MPTALPRRVPPVGLRVLDVAAPPELSCDALGGSGVGGRPEHRARIVAHGQPLLPRGPASVGERPLGHPVRGGLRHRMRRRLGGLRLGPTTVPA